jgi:hypothetical protein
VIHAAGAAGETSFQSIQALEHARRAFAICDGIGPHRGAQVGHGDCRLDAPTGNVTDDAAEPALLQGNDVEPVAPFEDLHAPRPRASGRRQPVVAQNTIRRARLALARHQAGLLVPAGVLDQALQATAGLAVIGGRRGQLRDVADR